MLMFPPVSINHYLIGAESSTLKKDFEMNFVLLSFHYYMYHVLP